MSHQKTIVRCKVFPSEKYTKLVNQMMCDAFDEATAEEMARWVFTVGVGLAQVSWDEATGRCVVKCLDPDEVYFKSKSVKLVPDT